MENLTTRGTPVCRVILVVAVVILLGSAWYHGMFDPVLVNVGLNARPCLQLYYGQTLCGDAAKDFCLRFDTYPSDRVCDEILGR